MKKFSKFFSTWSNSYKFGEFIETDVEERDNYSMKEIKVWMKKYKLTKSSNVVWITTNKFMANRYNYLADEWDLAESGKMPIKNLYVYESKYGRIIKESDDGDMGYLFIVDDKNALIGKCYREIRK